jgi:bifunctional DNase/RNase
MSSGEERKTYKVIYVEPFSQYIRDESIGLGAYIIGLKLGLENGRSFILVNVPADVAEAIRMINEGMAPPRRQSLFDLLANHEGFRGLFEEILEKVVIDELDQSTGLYTATVYFESNGISLKLKMIPSHAIYLALVAGRPIFVDENLLDEEDEELDLDEF